MPAYLELDSYIWYGHMRRNKFGGGVGVMMRASMVPDVIYRGDPEEDFEWMIVIHEAQKIFIGSVYYPRQGSSISKRFIDKVKNFSHRASTLSSLVTGMQVRRRGTILVQTNMGIIVDGIQKKALMKCLHVGVSLPLEVLEVEAQVEPLSIPGVGT